MNAANLPNPFEYAAELAIIVADTIPLQDRKGDFITERSNNPFDLNTSLIEQKVEYDIASGKYIVYEKIGDEYYRTPTYLTFDEYLEWKSKEQERAYFANLGGIQSNKKSGSGKMDPMSRIDISKSLVDRMFGGTEVNVKPQGGIDLTLGFFSYYLTRSNFGQRSPWNYLDPVDIKPRLTVDGNVGTKLKLNFNYDAQSSFNFDQKIKLQYDSQAFSEDDIIKKIEAGNVSLPLKGNLIQGAQSLMGIKTDLQFGHFRMTLLASQQQSKQNNVKVQNGASIVEFDDITSDQYDENRHFFLSHFNRETYERSLSKLPQVLTPFRIAQLEVWISDDRPDYQPGQNYIAAISDIAEGNLDKYNDPNGTLYPPYAILPEYLRDQRSNKPLADNRVNGLFQELVKNDTISSQDKTSTLLKNQFGLRQIRDFEIFRGRMLNPSEYTYHPQLGYISLNIRLRPNQVLGVAYKYFYTEQCDSVFTVGQLTGTSQETSDIRTSSPNQEEEGSPSKVLFVKLLKSSNQQVRLPSWDLMMKNVYNLKTNQLNKDGFQFDVFYEDDFSDGSLKKYIPERPDVPLLNVFKLDTLNKFGDPQADGVFDYVPGLTVIERSGSIIFPVLEPFGSSLDSLLKGLPDPGKYKYQELYDSTVTVARLTPQKNKFVMVGKVKSNATGEIPLGPFVPKNGVKVTAGTITLIEGVDYEIDYALGKLRILNPAYLAQGTPINVNYEDQSAFSSLNKTMLGARFDYDFSKKFTLGATYLRLRERPFTQKVNVGDDPIDNRIFGLDFNYSDKSDWITKVLDKLPFYSTKEESAVNLSAETAYLKPGHNKAINSQADSKDDGGLVNIDDFEGSVSGFTLGGFNTNSWALSSTPPEFREADLTNDLVYGANRAKISWYQIDQSVNTTEADRKHPFSRLVLQTDLFKRQVQTGINQLFTFDVSYYPEERGPYNFDVPEGYPNYTAGTSILDGQIRLNQPTTRWGGLMRYFQNTDFEANNYQFIEFWVLNPFLDKDGRPDPSNEEGEIVFQLGNVSEDVIRDNLQFFENALPTKEEPSVPIKNTNYGKVPLIPPLISNFALENIRQQDLGFDGLTDDEERIKFQSWVDKYGVIQGAVNADPAGDNFTFYNDEKLTGLDMVSRMKDFCGPEGNTPEESNFEDNRFYRGSRTPDSEDLNNDRSLNQGEAYYEYRIKVKNFNGEVDTASSIYYKQYKQVGDNEKWYRFVVPLNKFTSSQNITGFRAIQFMRMYFTNFEKQKTFRFAEFQLVRNQWRISQNQGDCKDGDKPFVSVDEVGVEENTTRLPFNYLVSPGVLQERINSSLGSNLLQDEKSLAINFCNLQRGAPGCDVAVNKLGNLDLNLYKKLQLFVHAESLPDEVYEHGDISIFIKLGKDLTNNYYEYVMPLKTSDFNIQSKENIWPDTNAINIPLSGFLDVKKARLVDGTTLELDDPDNEGAKFVMKGLPSLGYIKVIEIGVRNTSDKTKPLCGQIWVNELRASGLNEKGAFAAQAKAQIKLADLGDINAAGSYSSVGFGSLDQRLLERSRDEIFQYDFSTSLQAGKLLPKFLPISLPFFASYSRSVKKPQYDPYQRDLTVRELLEVTPDEDKQDVRDRAREETKITSYNLTNVKKEGGQGGKPWSLENLSATYAFTKTEKTDPIIKEDVTTERRVGLEYGFSNKPKYIQPLKFIKPKALKLISDFNFNPMPTSLGFNTNMDRYINYRTFRLPESPVFRFDDRRFKWERNYTLDWDFTKSLRLNFKANVTAVVDELRQVGIAPDPADRKWVDAQGRIASADTIDQYRNNSLGRLGRRKNYSHNLGLTYKIPVNLLPMMDWISASADYKSSYTWNAGPLIYIDDRFNLPGNVIQNTQNRSVNATFSFDKLYSKWGYLKKIESGDPRAKTGKSSKKKEEEGGLAKKEEGKDEPKDAADKNKKKDKKKDRYPSTFERILIRPLLALRSVKFSYKEDLGTLIPGFMPEASLLGLSDGFTSPGWQFASGLQPDLDKANPGNFLQKNNAWFNRSEAFNDQITQSERQNFNAKVAIEPFKDFKIDVDFNKDYRNSHTEVFKYKDDSFMQIARFNSGSFEATYASFGTLFDKSEALVAQFKANRAVVSHALKNYNPAEHPDYEGYAYGYGPTNFNVVVPSFLAAYRGVDVNKVPLDLKEDVKSYDYIPRPNWILRYDGLSKLPFFKNFLSSFSLKHGYKSTLSVANFNTQAEYDEAREFKTSENNYFSQIEIPAVTLKEEFSPLIGIDLKTKNNMEIKFEYKKGRTLDLRANSSELSESLNTSVVFGYGYVIDNFKGFGGGRKQRGSRGKRGDGLSGDKGDKDDKDPGGTLGAAGGKDDKSKKKDNKSSASGEKGKKLTINCDFSFKDDVTQNYSLDITEEKEPEKTRGTQTIQISPNVEYQMYKNLALRLYFEYQRTAPKVATNVTTNMSSGIVVRYMFN